MAAPGSAVGRPAVTNAEMRSQKPPLAAVRQLPERLGNQGVIISDRKLCQRATVHTGIVP